MLIFEPGRLDQVVEDVFDGHQRIHHRRIGRRQRLIAAQTELGVAEAELAQTVGQGLLAHQPENGRALGQEKGGALPALGLVQLLLAGHVLMNFAEVVQGHGAGVLDNVVDLQPPRVAGLTAQRLAQTLALGTALVQMAQALFHQNHGLGDLNPLGLAQLGLQHLIDPLQQQARRTQIQQRKNIDEIFIVAAQGLHVEAGAGAAHLFVDLVFIVFEDFVNLAGQGLVGFLADVRPLALVRSALVGQQSPNVFAGQLHGLQLGRANGAQMVDVVLHNQKTGGQFGADVLEALAVLVQVAIKNFFIEKGHALGQNLDQGGHFALLQQQKTAANFLEFHHCGFNAARFGALQPFHQLFFYRCDVERHFLLYARQKLIT